ncbi:transmembrane protein [Thalictrum thalictroides]|uniref:Transmembrane protein n=1 Tax=Thalictrum thalictroides TaxID=46969 RepID=A0A7J6WNV2_THATH|nr:transmembrane protein [Thalictrum thalictroides]
MRGFTQNQDEDHHHQQPSSSSSVRVFNELCCLVLNIIGHQQPHLLPSDTPNSNSMVSSSSSSKQISASGFACLLLGISLTLMLCGSVTFLIGFILMPWVVGFLFLCYLLGLGRAILCPLSPKEMSAWKFS